MPARPWAWDGKPGHLGWLHLQNMQRAVYSKLLTGGSPAGSRLKCARQGSRVWLVPWMDLCYHPCGFQKRVETGRLEFRGRRGRPLAGVWACWWPRRTVPWAGLPECLFSKSWDPNAASLESPSLTSVVGGVLPVNFQMAPVPPKAAVGPCPAPILSPCSLNSAWAQSTFLPPSGARNCSYRLGLLCRGQLRTQRVPLSGMGFLPQS